MKQILDYNHQDARKFLLKEESYFNFDLPNYFEFSTIIDGISKKIEGKKLEEFYKNINPRTRKPNKPFPSELENVNHILLNNKDGKYAWRPFQLIHPAIYVALVHSITDESNWAIIKKRFKKFSANPKIRCHSIPYESDTELSDKATSIANWRQTIEQNSLELALQYEYVMHTDITDCYASIYTHSIPWALHTKSFAKGNRGISHIGNLIDKYIRDMSYGQTNGIPQGSVLMDFIAEMILGYSDLKLTKKINEEGIIDYQILRYRDDYRIFTNNPQDAEKITKYLTEILIELGMRLNEHKTMVSENVIRDSIKDDKWHWNSERQGSKSLQGHLLLIHQLSEKFSNSGSLRKALDKFFSRIESLKEIKENIKVLISIIVDIGYKNPRTYPIVCGILSKLLSLIDDEPEQKAILSFINYRFEKIPNTGHIKIWLQRITIKTDRAIEYDELLCKRVNDNSIKIWNTKWLNNDLENIINQTNIINEDVISEIDTVIKSDEIKVFDY